MPTLDNIELMMEVMPWFFAFVVFAFGACVGSFLNVCIYRIPAGKSIVSPGSTCPACGAAIRWFDNIPILSWLVLRGRARCCGASISPRYLIIEALTGSLFLLAWLAYPPLVAFVGMVFLAFLIAASFIDLDHMIIPDRFSVGGMFIGLLLAFLVPELHGVPAHLPGASLYGFLSALLGVLVGTAVVYWIAALAEIILRREAMGQGDFKLMGCIGAFCGWQGSLFAIFGGAVVGTLLVFPMILWQRLRGQGKREPSPPDPEDESVGIPASALGLAVPFGPMLAIAGAAYFLFFGDRFDAYLSETWAALLWVFG